MRNYRELTFHEFHKKTFCLVFHKDDEEKFLNLVKKVVEGGSGGYICWQFLGRTVVLNMKHRDGHYMIKPVTKFRLWFRILFG